MKRLAALTRPLRVNAMGTAPETVEPSIGAWIATLLPLASAEVPRHTEKRHTNALAEIALKTNSCRSPLWTRLGELQSLGHWSDRRSAAFVKASGAPTARRL